MAVSKTGFREVKIEPVDSTAPFVCTIPVKEIKIVEEVEPASITSQDICFTIMDYRISKITRILNRFLNEQDFDCDCYFGPDFSYYPAVSQICYALTVSQRADAAFKAFVAKNFPNIHADIFLWSFLHELGHHETEDDFSNAEHIEYMRDLKRVTTDEEYFNLPIEFAATAWAAHYMETHAEIIEKLWKEVREAISHFYELFDTDKELEEKFLRNF